MIKYKLLIFLLVCITLNSCMDDLESCIDSSDNDIPEVFTDGYALNFKVTLDPMGGTRATGVDEANPMAELESYIDPEKFRVLFFDREDRFLFESKSRWVKKIVPNEHNDHAEWFVSVPLYDYGNDEAYNWKWEEIRRVLTGEDVDDADAGYTDETKNGDVAFKIAILANRPNTEWNMGINGRFSKESRGTHASVNVDGNGLAKNIETPNSTAQKREYYADGNDIPGLEITKNGWKLQNGPFWELVHTRWGNKTKTVFDLHHCQYDPIYHGKNYNDRGGIVGTKDENDYNYPNDVKEKIRENGGGIWERFGPVNLTSGNWTYNGNYFWYENLNVYDFIAGTVQEGEGFDDYIGKPTMGATSTWVSWKAEDNDTKLNSIRTFVPLTQDHPIPMYGIQAFAPIGKDWVKGTPFNLSYIADGQDKNDYEFKSISLLRSVVKLELILPGDIPENDLNVAMIYPNVYARCEPMDVWTPTDQIWTNDDSHDKKGLEGDCEWYRIRQYGPISTTNAYANPPADKKGKEVFTGSPAEYKKVMSWFYGAWLEKGWDKLDIRNKDNLDYPQVFNPCVQRNGQVSCAKVNYGPLYKDGKHHFIVYTGEKNINDPSNITEMGSAGNGNAPITSWWIRYDGHEYGIALAPHEGITNLTKSEATVKTSAYYCPTTADPTSRFRYYEYRVQGYDRIKPEEPDINKTEGLDKLDKKLMPWPLVRNHVYRIEIGELGGGTRSGGGMSIQTEVLSSKTINFDKPRKEKKEIEVEKKETEKK